jgi:hypothetical protein
MVQIVIHPQENGEIAIIVPTGEIPVEEVARKDVPPGVPYFILDHTELPHPDWDYSAAWEGDFSQAHGVGVGAEEWFAQKASTRC